MRARLFVLVAGVAEAYDGGGGDDGHGLAVLASIRLERVFMRLRAAHAREEQATRPPTQTRRQPLAAARAALDAKQPLEQVAAAFGVSRATLYGNLAEHNDQQTTS